MHIAGKGWPRASCLGCAGLGRRFSLVLRTSLHTLRYFFLSFPCHDKLAGSLEIPAEANPCRRKSRAALSFSSQLLSLLPSLSWPHPLPANLSLFSPNTTTPWPSSIPYPLKFSPKFPSAMIPTKSSHPPTAKPPGFPTTVAEAQAPCTRLPSSISSTKRRSPLSILALCAVRTASILLAAKSGSLPKPPRLLAASIPHPA